MAKLKIIPLGGLGEIGKNLTVYEYGQDILVVDCGLGFPDEELYGIDAVIPDITYLKQNKDRIRGIVITHGHEDHIGALPYVMRELDVPIYATSLTAGIIELKLEEFDLLYNTQIFTKKAGDRFKLGCFEVEMIHVNHSIADSVALAIKTPIGTVIHTGDFKIDVTPIQGEMIDLARWASWASRASWRCFRTRRTSSARVTLIPSARSRRSSTSFSRAAKSASSSLPSPRTSSASSRS